MEKILLIGGSSIDYIGTSLVELKKKDSNLGQVTISNGGVMRNVTENLARLGNDLTFITAIGQDVLGQNLKAKLVDLGVKVVSPETNIPTSSYLAINGLNHDMELAISDTRIIHLLNKEFLQKNFDLINSFNYIVLDSNLEVETLDFIFNNFSNKKFICEAVSCSKVGRLKSFLSNIYLLKSNLLEAKTLLGHDGEKEELVKELLASGIKNVVISDGERPIVYGNSEGVFESHIQKADYIENTTGCGDALFSGIIDHYLDNKSLKCAIEFGKKLSYLTLKVASSCSIELNKVK